MICLEEGVTEYNFPDGSQANSFSAPFPANLNPWKSLFIECGLLTNSDSAFFNKEKESIIQSVPITSNRGEQIIWEDQTSQIHKYISKFSESFRVRLLNDWGEVVELNCNNWSFEVYIEVN